jgi:hypothetical protein
MSPEQWGEVSDDGGTEVDGRADIYSLGAVFYELIAGRKPFMGRTLQELRREHVSVMPPPLHELMPDVPEAFSRAIARAMAKDRSQRQSTAGEVASELHTALVDAGLAQELGSSGARQATTPAATSLGTNPAGTPAQFSGELPEARSTNADVHAPTIMTLDAPPRPNAGAPSSSAQPSPPVQAPPPPNASSTHHNAPPMPTIATNPSALSASAQAAPPQQQQPPPAYSPTPSYAQTPSYTPAAAPPQKGRSPVVPIIAGVLGLLLLAGVGGGVLLWSRMKEEKPAETKTNVPTDAGKETTTTPTTAAEMRETLSYFLEVAGASKGTPSARVAGVVPLASGQKFRFHFTPSEDGYLYVVGPGEGNVPTTFLTAKPIEASGVDTNEVGAGTDFAFPDGEGNWIQLDKTEGTEYWTIIFSPTPLSAPAFLNAEAGSELSEEEQAAFKEFQAQHKANVPSTNVNSGAGVEPTVSVKVPAARAKDEPVVFDIRIEHK